MRLNEQGRNRLSLYLIVAGILVLANLFSVRTFFRLDLTRSHAYSLSAVSKQYMRNLKDPLTVKAFFSQQLPPPYNANARYLRDLLEDYRIYSRGRFNYQFVDPAEDPALQREARTLGVYEIQLTAVARDKFEQKTGFMGLAMFYGNRQEVLPLLQDTSGLEYQLSSMIKKLMQEKKKVLGITQGHGEPALESDLSNFSQIISGNYEVVPVHLGGEAIPDRVDALVVPGPTEALDEVSRYRLDHFLRSGRSLALMVQMIKADARSTMQGRPLMTHLNELAAAWGVNVAPNLIYDVQCQKIAVAQRGPGFIMQNIVAYPPFPLVTNINAKHLMVKNLESFTLPFVSEVSPNEAVCKQNQLDCQVVAKSSPRAWAQQNFFMLSPQFIQPPQGQEPKQFPLLVTVSGKFPGAFAADKVPASGSPSDAPLPPFAAEAKPSRLVVVGGADFLTNDFIDPRRQGDVIQLAQNLVDWVAQDSALIEIRGKETTPPALGQVGEAHRQAVKYFNWLGLPLLVVLAGLVMWRRQAARQLALAQRYAGGAKTQ
ncbi:MAG: GldG family protein [candidate division FCPU426 bacterium]